MLSYRMDSFIFEAYDRLKNESNMEAELATIEINRAMMLRRIKPRKLVIHTDRDSQYTGSKYQKLLIKNKINCSMSRKRDCWDNAKMESFFSTCKLKTI